MEYSHVGVSVCVVGIIERGQYTEAMLQKQWAKDG